MKTAKLLPKSAAKPGSLRVSALDDIFLGALRWDVWGRLGWLEIRRRYRRTVIGPFWSAISLAMFVVALGTVGSGLWNQQAGEYMTFLAAGFVVWVTLSSILVESCLMFVQSGNIFGQVQLKYSILAYALVWRNLITFAHNFVVYLILVIIFAPQYLTSVTLLAIPGLALVMFNGIWIALLLGMLALRYRDIQQLVASVVQIAMFITPIFWPPAALQASGRSAIFVDYNPLYHFINVARAPLLGEIPSLLNYIVVFGCTIVGWTGAILIFAHFRKRIAYWK
jgi:ABC-type polysaccharide/polyol phosphate export permease